ncbi:MAG TPA: hypothetical protein VLF67_03070 [Candidatus Saccharimonas sp.]|nr:hypothetical protein [Candidatus Saccharimonas sp.]
MEKPLSFRRIIENEVLFRGRNESMQQRVKELTKMANHGVEDESAEEADQPLYFYCVCADEKCRQRIMLTMGEYQRLHRNRKRFMVIKGHEIKEAERVVMEAPAFFVVEKLV